MTRSWREMLKTKNESMIKRCCRTSLQKSKVKKGGQQILVAYLATIDFIEFRHINNNKNTNNNNNNNNKNNNNTTNSNNSNSSNNSSN